jgi:hypothetical protein
MLSGQGLLHQDSVESVNLADTCWLLACSGFLICNLYGIYLFDGFQENLPAISLDKRITGFATDDTVME